MKRLILFLCTLSLSFSGHTQDVTGIWKGYFISNDGDYYKLEFQVSQDKNNAVTGVSYSYLDVRFYGKATMTGNFSHAGNTFKIREIKTVEVKSSLGGATCIMNYNFTYSKSGREEFLEGTYLGKYESATGSASGSWGDCGGGKVMLRKVETSDFYIEPFLRNKKKEDEPVIYNKPPEKKDSIGVKKPTPKNIPAKKPVVKPMPTVKVPIPPLKKPENKPVAKTNPVTKPVNKPVGKPADKPVAKVNPPVIKKPVIDSTVIVKPKVPEVPVQKPLVTVPTPALIKNRSNELVKTLTVTDPAVTVSLYDNGEIDDDTITVYLDKRLVLDAKRLTASPLTIHLTMEKDNEEHELVMVANNLGRIPPNTSLMIVEAGDQRFEVRITSTEQKNAVVRFRYQKPD